MPEYRLGGVPVSFPFPAYDCQIVYMERVIEALQQKKNALLESPTGTGKTLCLLCSTLAWRESLGPTILKSMDDMDDPVSPFKPKLPAIIYASRTHSQLQQVIRELKSTSYRPKMVVLGSREQMCINSDIKQLRGRVQNQACRALCKSRSCHHQNKVAGYLQSHPQLGEEPFDIEDIVSIGRTQGPCPYYLSRELHNSADILFVPYNYLIDKENRNSLTGINWENTVLIFDEAHNLEGICADAASFDLPATHLSACITEARQCVDLALTHRGRDNSSDTSIDPENFAILKALLIELEKRINDATLAEEIGFTKPGPYIYDFLADIKINQDTVNMLVDTIDHAMNLLEDDLGSVKPHKRPGSACRLQVLRDALRIIFRGNDKSHASCYRFHIHESYNQESDKSQHKGSKGRTLSWWCFNPGFAMEEFSQLGVRSIILTSGTLAPLDSFALELKLPFNVRLENPHVIGPDQIWVGVISTGPSGRALNSSYRMRDTSDYKADLGNTIVNFARIVPDGLLVFFPSYYLLNKCVEAWQMPNLMQPKMATIWERICKHKQPVIEPKESALFNHANEDFIMKLNDLSSSGAIFFAVCRGKVSEGLDFADKAGRAVVITGIPYAMKTDPKVRLKREYLDEQCRIQSNKKKVLTGEEWYLQQASRAVNQAVGRVIRHKKDYGAIILCDERFAQGTMQNQMSLWIRPHIKCYSKFGDATYTLTRFFRDKSSSNLAAKPILNQHESGISRKSSLDADLPSTESHNQRSFYPNNQGQEAGVGTGVGKASSIDNVKLLSQKFTQPLALHSHPTLNASTLSTPKSLSEILASSRGKSTIKCKPSLDVTPANRATRSEAVANVYGGLKRKRELENEGNSEIMSDVVDLGSPLASKKKSETNLHKNTESPQNLEHGGQLNQEGSEKSDKKGLSISKDDIKNKNSADFLKEVKAHLSAPDYKRFLEYMTGFKQQKTDMKTVLQGVSNLFSAPQRIFLLHRFGEFVPTQHRGLYAQYLAEKSAAVDELSGRQFPGDRNSADGQTSTAFHGFPSRSRKRQGN